MEVTEEVKQNANIMIDSANNEQQILDDLESRPENPFLCHLCGAVYTTKLSLATHLKAHLFKEEPYLLKSDKYDRMFQHKSSLTCHKSKHQKGGHLTCEECGKKFTRKSNLKRHKLMIHDGRDSREPYTCDTCGKQFAYRRYLIHHIRYHTGDVIYECNVCLKVLKCKKSLNLHMLTHSQERKYMCLICSKTFKHNRYLSRHMKLHTSPKPSIPCRICNVSYSSRLDLRKHMATHKELKSFYCNLCNQDFGNRIRWNKHRESHIAENSWKCVKCCEIFSNKGILNSHRRNEHRNITPEDMCKCNFCGQTFTHSGTLKLHQKTHIAENSWKCLDCSEIFSSKCLLLHHRKMKHNKLPNRFEHCDKTFTRNFHKEDHTAEYSWKCHVCREILPDRSSLTSHKKIGCTIKTHKNVKKYVCKLCNTWFDSKREMVKHRKTYPFKCEFCHKVFHLESNLTAHNKIHIAKNSWRCKECNRVFQDMRSLVVHLNVNHFDKRKKTSKIACDECPENKEHTQHNVSENTTQDLKRKSMPWASLLLSKAPKESPIHLKVNSESSERLSKAQKKSPIHLEMNPKTQKRLPKTSKKSKVHIEVRPESPDTLTCLPCGFKFKFRISFQEHKRIHSEYTCYHCTLAFPNVKTYSYHMKTHDFSCGVCNIWFKTVALLCKHLAIHHEIGYKCKLCNMKILEASHYKRHLLRIHKTEFTCKLCFLKCHSKSQLDMHIFDAHKKLFCAQNLYYCEYCGESFLTRLHLTIHTDKEHEHRNECKHFKTEFLSKYEWKSNKCVFHYKRQKSVYCNLCKKHINIQKASNYHFLVQNTLKMYGCSKCQKIFLQECRMREHEFVHTMVEKISKLQDDANVSKDKSIFGSSEDLSNHGEQTKSLPLNSVRPNQNLDTSLVDENNGLAASYVTTDVAGQSNNIEMSTDTLENLNEENYKESGNRERTASPNTSIRYDQNVSVLTANTSPCHMHVDGYKIEVNEDFESDFESETDSCVNLERAETTKSEYLDGTANDNAEGLEARKVVLNHPLAYKAAGNGPQETVNKIIQIPSSTAHYLLKEINLSDTTDGYSDIEGKKISILKDHTYAKSLRIVGAHAKSLRVVGAHAKSLRVVGAYAKSLRVVGALSYVEIKVEAEDPIMSVDEHQMIMQESNQRNEKVETKKEFDEVISVAGEYPHTIEKTNQISDNDEVKVEIGDKTMSLYGCPQITKILKQTNQCVEINQKVNETMDEYPHMQTLNQTNENVQIKVEVDEVDTVIDQNPVMIKTLNQENKNVKSKVNDDDIITSINEYLKIMQASNKVNENAEVEIGFDDVSTVYGNYPRIKTIKQTNAHVENEIEVNNAIMAVDDSQQFMQTEEQSNKQEKVGLELTGLDFTFTRICDLKDNKSEDSGIDTVKVNNKLDKKTLKGMSQFEKSLNSKLDLAGKKDVTKQKLKGNSDNNSAGQYLCSFCKVEFPNRISCWIHLRDHCDKYFDLTCDICYHKFFRMDDVIVHKTNDHKRKSQPYRCCFCSEKFSDKDVCKYHIKFKLCEQPRHVDWSKFKNVAGNN